MHQCHEAGGLPISLEIAPHESVSCPKGLRRRYLTTTKKKKKGGGVVLNTIWFCIFTCHGTSDLLKVLT